MSLLPKYVRAEFLRDRVGDYRSEGMSVELNEIAAAEVGGHLSTDQDEMTGSPYFGKESGYIFRARNPARILKVIKT